MLNGIFKLSKNIATKQWNINEKVKENEIINLNKKSYDFTRIFRNYI